MSLKGISSLSKQMVYIIHSNSSHRIILAIQFLRNSEAIEKFCNTERVWHCPLLTGWQCSRLLWIPSQLRTTTIRWLAHPTGLEYECYRSFQQSSLFSKHETLYSVSNIQETLLEGSIIWQRKKWPYSQSRHSSYFYNLKHRELGMQLRGSVLEKNQGPGSVPRTAQN